MLNFNFLDLSSLICVINMKSFVKLTIINPRRRRLAERSSSANYLISIKHRFSVLPEVAIYRNMQWFGYADCDLFWPVAIVANVATFIFGRTVTQDPDIYEKTNFIMSDFCQLDIVKPIQKPSQNDFQVYFISENVV